MIAGDDFGVTAFGKHPGWADHIDDIPIPTPELGLVRELLYARGIRRVIDRGGWAELPDDRRLGGFDHRFLWYIEGKAVIGRMRRSTDTSGRSAYPFVVCAQAPEEFSGWLVAHGGPILDRLEARCMELTDSAGVRAAVADAHAELRSLCSEAEEPVAASTHTGDASEGESPGRTGLYRILFQIEREMRAFGAGVRGSGTEKFDPSSRHIRLPGRGKGDLQELWAWGGFMREHLSAGTPILAVCPSEAAWCDVIVGKLDDGSLVPMMMNASGMRPASEEAYELDDEFLSRADAAIGRTVEEIAERERAGLERLRRATGAMRKGADAARSKGLGIGRWFRGKSG